MHFLNRIVENKRARLRQKQRAIPISKLEEEARIRRNNEIPYRFSSILNTGSFPAIIAEFKRQSPSRGTIRAGAEPVALARKYEAGGATAVSVLTEEDSFLGSLADLQFIHEACSLPLLRKDFIIDRYQVFETAAAGADALLLIVSILQDRTLDDLYNSCEEIGIDALVEVHTQSEMNRALTLKPRLIGVNNRDLNTFAVSLETSFRLAPLGAGRAMLVSESGIDSLEQMEKLRTAGYQAFLVGESLMRAADPERLLRSWTSKSD